jgi:organic radical activating enzyme
MNLKSLSHNHLYTNIDYHIVDGCNLACEGCSHWTDVYDLKNVVDVNTFKEEVTHWINKISKVGYYYDYLVILGGEPLLHPRLLDILNISLDITKNLPTKVKLITNGQLFHKHPKLWDFVLSQNPKNFNLKITFHINNVEYLKKYIGPYRKELLEYCKLIKDHNKIFALSSASKSWFSNRNKMQQNSLISPYKIVDPKIGYESEMSCAIYLCHSIHNNKLWKCAHLAYMPLEKVDQTFRDLHNSFTPIGIECSDEQLKEFLLQQEIPACAGCATYSDYDFKVLDKINKKTYRNVQ